MCMVGLLLVCVWMWAVCDLYMCQEQLLGDGAQCVSSVVQRSLWLWCNKAACNNRSTVAWYLTLVSIHCCFLWFAILLSCILCVPYTNNTTSTVWLPLHSVYEITVHNLKFTLAIATVSYWLCVLQFVFQSLFLLRLPRWRSCNQVVAFSVVIHVVLLCGVLL